MSLTEDALEAGRMGDALSDVVGEEQVSLCSLMAGEMLFGIDTRMIREVLRRGELNRVPLAPAWIGGVLAYRGEVVTAVSLRALLSGSSGNNESQCTVLVLDGDAEEERFGLLVDRVGGVVMVERKRRAENPSTLDEASRALFCGTYDTAEGLLVQLDPERLKPSRLAESGLFRQGLRSQATRPAAWAQGEVK